LKIRLCFFLQTWLWAMWPRIEKVTHPAKRQVPVLTRQVMIESLKLNIFNKDNNLVFKSCLQHSLQYDIWCLWTKLRLWNKIPTTFSDERQYWFSLFNMLIKWNKNDGIVTLKNE
jgi:hypothetical protein